MKKKHNYRALGCTLINKMKTHCPKGHEYSEKNTEYSENHRGSISRKCRTCRAESLARFAEKLKAKLRDE